MVFKIFKIFKIKYRNNNNYYNDILKEKKYKKYLNSEVFFPFANFENVANWNRLKITLIGHGKLLFF